MVLNLTLALGLGLGLGLLESGQIPYYFMGFQLAQLLVDLKVNSKGGNANSCWFACPNFFKYHNLSYKRT